MKFTDKKIPGAGIFLVVLLCICVPKNTYATVPAEQMDGVMGQSIRDETELSLDERILKAAPSAMTLYGATAASGYSSAFLNASFTIASPYTKKTYYHNNCYKDYNLFQGIDVSWWQGGGKGSSSTKINWAKAHDDGIDFAIVRGASRDTGDGSIYEDTCADAHIKGALASNVNVGLYVFSQALTQKEAQEEADYLLMLVDKYGWDITMPLVIDREAGSYKRLTAGKLSKTKETAICQAFVDVIHDAGYEAAVYASYSWFNNYINTAALDCDLWIARYNTTTTSNSQSGTPYSDVPDGYSFWQYASSGVKLSGFSGSALDMDFWYKDTSVRTTGLKMKSNTTVSITLGWSAADDAIRYRVYRYNSTTGSYERIATTSGRTYTDTGLKPGKTCQYKVRGVWTIGGTNYFGAYSPVLKAETKLLKTTGLTVTAENTASVKLKWKKVSGAAGYAVYRLDTASGKYKKIKTVNKGTTVSYTDTGLSSGKKYTYKVRAYMMDKTLRCYGSYSDVKAGSTKPSQVKKVTLKAKSSAITVKWTKVSRATGYRIYRLNNKTKKYERIATVTGPDKLSYTDTKRKKNTTYTYKVRAYKTCGGQTCYGSYSPVEKVKAK